MNRDKLVSLVFAFVVGSTLTLASVVEAQDGDTYTMNGKVISKSMYEAGLLLNEGIELLSKNQNSDAADKFQKALTLAPDFPEVHHNLGIALAKIGQAEQAVLALERARELNPGLDATWISLGGMYQSQGRIEEAIKTYREFLKLFPNNKDSEKIASLVIGLEKERIREVQGNQQNVNQNDYLQEVTRAGIIRWPLTSMPLKVFIGSGAGVEGFKPEFDTILRNAFVDWTQASGGSVSFLFVDSQSASDVECYWTSDPTRFKNIAEAGETRLFSSSKGLAKGVMKLLTVPLVKETQVTDNRMKVICLHEIGHVLGLAGHTRNPRDIMFYSIGVTDQAPVLGTRDANTIKLLYAR